ncbi:MAG: hypothetical protein NEA02_15880 [Thermoanaerobaculia bacterium]|nr:hypothetical protein [Thermoanaerobaculia bacterium]
MLTDVLALVLLQLALGVAFWTAVTSSKDLSGGFFVLHGATVALCLVLVWLSSGTGGGIFLRKGMGGDATAGGVLSPVSPRFLLVAAIATAVAATLAARMHTPAFLTPSKNLLFPPLSKNLFFFLSLSKNLLFLSFLFSASLLLSRVSVEPFRSLRGIGPIWLGVGLVLGALLFGAVYCAMNVGHWYLVSASLPFGLLVRATEAFAVLAAIRATYAVVALGVVARGSTGEGGEALAYILDPMRDGFFFWSRVLWGLVAPLALAPFVVKTARMKSNQAATGLLYVGLVFVLVGELLASYLTLRSGLPV